MDELERYKECWINPSVLYKTDYCPDIRLLYYKENPEDEDCKFDSDEDIRLMYHKRRFNKGTIEFVDFSFMEDKEERVKQTCINLLKGLPR